MRFLADLQQLSVCLLDETFDFWISNTLIQVGKEKTCHKVAPILLHQVSHSNLALEEFLRVTQIDVVC